MNHLILSCFLAYTRIHLAAKGSKELTLWNCNVKYELNSNGTLSGFTYTGRPPVHFNFGKVHAVDDSVTMVDFGHDCFSHFTYGGLASVEDGKVTLWNDDRPMAYVIMQDDGEWKDDKGTIFQPHPCEIKKFRNP